MLNRKKWQDYKTYLKLKDFGLFFGLTIVCFLFSLFAFGDYLSAFGAIVVPIVFSLYITHSPKMFLKIHNGRPLVYDQAPWLFETVDSLSAKAQIESSPELYILETNTPNAFTTEGKDGAILAISTGLLSHMNEREMRGVLAHELSHIAHHDAVFLKMVQGLYSFVAFVSTFVHISIIIFLPFYFFGEFAISSKLLIAILVAPSVLRLLILAIMRNREYAADLNAVNLTGDPEGLALALSRLNSMNNWAIGLVFPFRFSKKTSLLDTHPLPSERIKRLMDLAR